MKISTVFILSFLFISCKHKVSTQWNETNFDSTISFNPTYSQLEKQKEILSALEIDSLMKKTSDVTYVLARDEKNLLFSSKFFNCRSYYLQSDTLSINIGIGNGFGGNGFIIHYDKTKFYTEPYFSTDVIIENEPKAVFDIHEQKLTLNKSKFKIGDSLYGKIYFHVTETKEGLKTEHFGQGYFRTKVKSF